VHGVNLCVRAGEVLGLGGLTGAGRTELAQVLFGLTPAHGGQILLKGRPVSIDSPTKAVDLGIAYLPEDRRRHGVILDMPVASNTTLTVLGRISRAGMIDFARERALSADFVRRMGTKTPSVDTLVGNLSGGNQQKVALSKWLATEPAVVILDEPTQGVDIGAKAEIHRQIGELAARGLAIILISSELMELMGMSDRIAVMHGGRVAGVLSRAEATQENVLALALGHEVAA
jgi:rhamnose transport system ATP-binding protein